MLRLPNPSLRRRLSLLLVLAVFAWLLLSLAAYFLLMRMLRQSQANLRSRSQTLALQVIDHAFEQLRWNVEEPAAWQALRQRLDSPGPAPFWQNPVLDLFLAFDDSGKLVYRYEREGRGLCQDLQDFQYHIYVAALDSQKSFQGFTASRQGIYLLAAGNFSRVDGTHSGAELQRRAGAISTPQSKSHAGSVAGLGLALRRLDERLAASIKAFANADVVFYRHGKPIVSTLAGVPQLTASSPGDQQPEKSAFFSWAQDPEFEQPPAISLNDGFGLPVAQMRILHSSEDNRRLRHAIAVGSLCFVGVSLFIFGVAAIAMERWIVWPLRQLQTQVRSLQANDRYGSRLAMKRRDEIGELATSINALMLQGETAQRQSLQAHALIQQIVQSAGVGIVALNHHGQVLILNQKLEELLGCTSDEVETRGWFESIYRDPEERQAAVDKWRKLLGDRISSTEEWQVATPSGSRRTLAVITTPVRRPAGEAIATISFCHDITKEKQLENQLEQTRRLASLGTLAGGIAHNFNNILCGILGYTTLGRERLPADDPVREYFAIIEQSATRASQLTQQLLMFSKGGQGAFQLVDLRPLIHEVVSLLRDTLPKNITIEEIYHNDWLFLKADGSQLYQSLINICLNARDAMPNGGCLTIESKLENYDSASLPAPQLAPGRFACMRISDTGTGMSDEVKQRAFEPLFTTKAPGKGTGLGLATVYGTIRSHRGHIQVVSQVGRGTSFIIYLPALKDIFSGQESTKTATSAASRELAGATLQQQRHAQ